MMVRLTFSISKSETWKKPTQITLTLQALLASSAHAPSVQSDYDQTVISEALIKTENDNCNNLDDEEDTTEEDDEKDDNLKDDSKEGNNKPPYSYVAMIGT